MAYHSAMDWVNEFPGAVTVCDRQGVILAMNRRAIENYQAEGGERLIGRNLLDCHPEPSRTKVAEMLASGGANVYTVQRQGVRKLVYQSPWTVDGRRRGLVEIVLELPAELPHFDRDAARQPKPV